MQGIGRRAKLLEGGRSSMQCARVAVVSCMATNTNAALFPTSTLALPSTALTLCWWMPAENQTRKRSRRSCCVTVPNSLQAKPPRCSGMTREPIGFSSSQIRLRPGFGLRTVATRSAVMIARGYIALTAAADFLTVTPGTNSGDSRCDIPQSTFHSVIPRPLPN